MSLNCDIKISGVVVLYNPDVDLIIQNIGSYIDKLVSLQVIDNTINAVPHVKEALQNAFGAKINYISFNRNLGIAKALNVGVENALRDKTDWLLTLDQDSFFEIDKYFEVFQSINKEGIAVIGPEPVVELPKETRPIVVEQIEAVITSGSFVRVRAWQKTGGFRDEFFIDDVDTDFCFKCIDAGYKVVIVRGTYINHFVGTVKERRYFFSKRKLELHSPIRLYYIVRNGLYMKREYKQRFPERVAFCQDVINKRIKHNVVSGGNPLKYIGYILLGAYHYYTNKLGSYDDIRFSNKAQR